MLFSRAPRSCSSLALALLVLATVLALVLSSSSSWNVSAMPASRRAARDQVFEMPSVTEADAQSVASSRVILNDVLATSGPKAAREATRVHLPASSFAQGGGSSSDARLRAAYLDTTYAGYVTVDPTYNSNLFWWFFPAENGNTSAPVLMWMNGGPGATSLYGLFEELGPFSVDANGTTLVPREYTWNRNYAMLFVDNPVGTGWSFTDDVRGFSTDQKEVATNLYTLLVTFFTAFPDYVKNPFYVTGESYAGKYVPSLANYIHTMNLENPKVRINLRGVSIGDGLMDPLTQIPGYGDLLYQEGMASVAQHQVWLDAEAQIIKLIEAGNTTAAFRIFDYMLNGDFYGPLTYYFNTTGLTDYFNFLQPTYPPNNWQTWVTSPAVRAAIHVGDHPFSPQNSTVEFHLLADWFRSVKDVLPTLLDSYKVLIYNGQNDVILSGPACQNFLNTALAWGQIDAWKATPRTLWTVFANDTQPAGYAQQYKNFVYVLVRDAGHLLPQDQPVRAFDMITRFVEGTPFAQAPSAQEQQQVEQQVVVQ